MKELNGYICQEWIKKGTTSMMPTDTTTINDLITALLQQKNEKIFISINDHNKSSNPIKISDNDELQKYFCHKIIWILCTTTEKWELYYDVFIDYGTIKLNGIERELNWWTSHFWEKWTDCDVISSYINKDKLDNNFDCENTWKLNTILVNDKEKSGYLFNLTPKTNKTITIENFIKRINIKSDLPSYISIEFNGSGRTTDFQKINWQEIDPDISSYKIISWAITIWKDGVYYAILVETPTEETWKKD